MCQKLQNIRSHCFSHQIVSLLDFYAKDLTVSNREIKEGFAKMSGLQKYILKTAI